MEYKAEDFISFIENNRRDKVSPNGLELIVKRFRELECEVNKLSLGAVSGQSEQLPNSCECDNVETFNGWGNEKCIRCIDCGRVW